MRFSATSAVALLSTSAMVLVFVLPHGQIQTNQKIYLYNSTAADLYQRSTVWDKWWKVYSIAASTLVSALCVLLVADITNQRALKIAVAVTSVLLHIVTMFSFTLVHEMEHSAIADSSSSEHNVKTTTGIAVWVQFALPFLSYYKHIAL